MSGPKKRKKLKKSVHDIEEYSKFFKSLSGQGFKGLGKFLKREFTPVPKHIKERRKLKHLSSGGLAQRGYGKARN